MKALKARGFDLVFFCAFVHEMNKMFLKAILNIILITLTIMSGCVILNMQIIK
jgi:hypothetical protein